MEEILDNIQGNTIQSTEIVDLNTIRIFFNATYIEITATGDINNGELVITHNYI